jgi:hypothetical protein
MFHVRTHGREFFTSDKPRPTEITIRNKQGIDTSYDGYAVTAYYKNGGQAEANFSCGTIASGAFNIAWPTGTSIFVEAGTIRVDFKAASGAVSEFIARAIFQVKERV